MATINLGRVKPVFRGAYSGATAYVVDDIVTYSNETYICILASTGNLPTDTTYWTKLAAKGVDGTDVSTTLTTQGDLLYRDGSGLQRLAAGTSGQFLKTQGTGANPVWATVSTTGKIINTQTLQDNTNYSHTNSGETVSGSGLSYTPQSTTSQVMVFYAVHGQIESDGSDNDFRTKYRVFSTNSAGNPIYADNSDSGDYNIGQANMSTGGVIWGAVSGTIENASRDASNNVVIKVSSYSNIDPGTTTYVNHLKAVFMEIE